MSSARLPRTIWHTDCRRLVCGVACAADKVLQLREPANYVSAEAAISLGRISCHLPSGHKNKTPGDCK